MAVSDDQALVLREQFPLPSAYVAPRTDTERCLAEIWRMALSMDRVGVHDDYNDLGGDSLTARVIFARIEAAFEVAVPLGALTQASTVEALARSIDALAVSRGPYPGAPEE